MHTKAISERELVIKSMEEVCHKEGFADPKDMVQRNLEFLAASIESKTGILISLSTIKRLINGEFSRLPQIATLNAIAIFLGYANWQEYKINKVNQLPPIVTNARENQESALTRSLQSRKGSYKKYLLAGGLVTFAALGLLAILKFRKPGPQNIEKSEFSARKTTNNDLPNTVVFKYNIDEVIADSFFIQQSWDSNRRVKIYKNNYTLTDIYYEPGYHIAKLIANDQIIKTVDVSIPTDRWFFYAKERIPKAQPKYIQVGSGIQNGALQLLPQEIANNQIDMQRKNEYIYLYFPSKIECSSDNFTMKFRIKVNPVNNDFCPYFMAEVFCQRNFMYFISTPKGCASEMITQFGENLQSGKTNDFSALATEPKAWQDVELLVKNKNVNIKINNKEVFSTIYQQSAGLLTGLGFMSNGLVEVDFVELKTFDGREVYISNFE